jgi:hypothetical protein
MQISAVSKSLSVFFLFAFFFMSLLHIQVSNYDLWWHLATGKYMVENKALPESDPFAYTTPSAPSDTKSLLLKGYWLAQIVFYEVFKLWNVKGIVVLRALSLTLFLFFAYLTMKKKKISFAVSILATVLLFWYSLIIEGERPQLFSILFFSLVYFLLEDFRTTRSKKVFYIPFIVMVLANMYPGYIICILLVSIYLFGEWVRILLNRAENRDIFKTLLIVWVLSVVLSFANPNGALVFKQIYLSQLFTKGTSHVVEFLPTFFVYSKKIIPLDYSYIIFLLVSLLSLRYARKIGLIHILLVIVFSLMSIIAYRYVVFYMCIMTPIIALLITNLRGERIFRGLTGKQLVREGFIAGMVLFIGIVLVIYSLHSLKKFNYKENTFLMVPKGATDFLSQVNIKGNILNEYNFGGYLIWRLYPSKKVFIDSRSLDPGVIDEYKIFANAKDSAGQSWEAIVNKYNITHVLLPPLWQNGNIIAVVEKLLDSDEWELVYADHLVLIFVHKDHENEGVIEKYRMDKKRGLNTILVQASAWALVNRGNPNYLISAGRGFYKMGRLDDAEKAFSMAYKIEPGNAVIHEYQNRINEQKGKNQK